MYDVKYSLCCDFKYLYSIKESTAIKNVPKILSQLVLKLYHD